MGSSKPRQLLLFDIDGTILLSDGIGRRLLDEALAARFGPKVTSDGVNFSGRTDYAIVGDALRNHGICNSEHTQLILQILDDYSARAQDRILPSDVRLLPGVDRLLQRLHLHSGVQLGLLTGNLKATAYFKLEAAGIASLFPFGAFGNNHADRNALPALAWAQAYEHDGTRYAGQDTVIIGDSVHDVRCGRAAGAFCVAVATGHTSATVLSAEAPDLLLADLSDADYFCSAVLGSAPPMPPVPDCNDSPMNQR